MFQRGPEVTAETSQMRKRIRYMELKHATPDGQREEILHHCGHCSARLFLEGRHVLDAPPHAVLEALRLPQEQQADTQQQAGSQEPQRKRQHTVHKCLQELTDAKLLLDAEALTQDEFTYFLKARAA